MRCIRKEGGIGGRGGNAFWLVSFRVDVFVDRATERKLVEELSDVKR